MGGDWIFLAGWLIFCEGNGAGGGGRLEVAGMLWEEARRVSDGTGGGGGLEEKDHPEGLIALLVMDERVGRWWRSG